MCVMAGYMGKRNAAPILLEMLKKTEGFDGGYYTGIATIHEGKLHYAKLMGDTARLEVLTDAAQLPGTIGIIHSRTCGGGDDTWAQPFISDNGNMAYIANGSKGRFADTYETGFADMLEAAGYVYTSKADLDVKTSPMLSDGKRVHTSEFKAHGISYWMQNGYSPRAAMEKMFCEYPGEIVGLMLHASVADRIFVARVNQPMMVGFGEGECFLATNAVAFPENSGIREICPVEPNVSCEVTKDSIYVTPFKNPPCTVAPVSPEIWHRAYTGISEKLKAEAGTPCLFTDFRAVVSALFPEDSAPPLNFIIYETLRSLYAQKRICFAVTRTVNKFTGLEAPKVKILWVE